MRYIGLGFIIFLISSFSLAHAQTKSPLCHLLHNPSSDIHFKPGVDVHGKAVAPADLNQPPVIVENVIKIPLTIDMAARLGRRIPAGTELETSLGLIEIYPDGRVVYNGEDWRDQANALCHTEKHHRQKTPNPLTSENYQKPSSDVIQGEDFMEEGL